LTHGIHAFSDVSKVCLNHGTVAGVTSGDKWVPPPNVAADGGVSDISSRSVQTQCRLVSADG